MKKNKIMFFSFSLARGGAEKVFSTIANNLDKTKYEVIYVIIKNYSDIFKLNNDIELICTGDNRSFKSVIKIFQLIKKYKPDTIISTIFQINIILGFIGSFYNVFYGKRIKLIMRETSIPSIYLHRNRFPSWILKFLLKSIYPKFNTIISQGIAMKNDLIDNFGISKSIIKIIKNPLEKLNIEKKPFPIKRDKYRLISVGNLTSLKGYDRLLKIIKELDKKIKFEYLIFGVGPKYLEIYNLIEEYGLNDSCKLMGSTSEPLYEISISDLFLHGSYFEGFPNVLLEANSVGIPVIAFDSPGGTNEIIIPWLNGVLIRDGDINSFVANVIIALSFNFDKKKIIESTFGHSVNEIVKEYENILDEHEYN